MVVDVELDAGSDKKAPELASCREIPQIFFMLYLISASGTIVLTRIEA